ncbi:hypothetical protein PIB30_080559, partial [Stylosanthes scabra]|nr:hypothetical protein [Stylosanthes scabra]
MPKCGSNVMPTKPKQAKKTHPGEDKATSKCGQGEEKHGSKQAREAHLRAKGTMFGSRPNVVQHPSKQAQGGLGVAQTWPFMAAPNPTTPRLGSSSLGVALFPDQTQDQ